MQPTADEPQSSSGSSGGPLPGSIGRYRILERLGAGGMGTVYKAHDPQLDRVVAVKMPRFDGPEHNRATRLQRFQREARTAAQVWRPHVCPIYCRSRGQGSRCLPKSSRNHRRCHPACGPAWNPELDAIMLKTLAKSAPERYPNARNFAAALAGWCATNAWTTTLGRNRADAKAVMPNQIVTAIKTARSYPIMEDLRRYWLLLLLFVFAGCVLWMAHNVSSRELKQQEIFVACSFGLAALSVLTWTALVTRERLKLRRNWAGETKLMIAAKNGDAAAVTRFISCDLLASGAEVNEKDQDGRTALMRAEAKGHETIVELLKQAGAKE